jgi:uncharacterized small protein (DUF1192 family)
MDNQLRTDKKVIDQALHDLNPALGVYRAQKMLHDSLTGVSDVYKRIAVAEVAARKAEERVKELNKAYADAVHRMAVEKEEQVRQDDEQHRLLATARAKAMRGEEGDLKKEIARLVAERNKAVASLGDCTEDTAKQKSKLYADVAAYEDKLRDARVAYTTETNKLIVKRGDAEKALRVQEVNHRSLTKAMQEQLGVLKQHAEDLREGLRAL